MIETLRISSGTVCRPWRIMMAVGVQELNINIDERQLYLHALAVIDCRNDTAGWTELL